MMQPWFRALARKVLSGRQLQATPRRARGRSVRLGCELLEDRVLMYAANFGQPELLPPAPATSPAIFWWAQIAPSYSEEMEDLVRSVQWNVPGLNQLLADLRWPAAPPPTTSGFSPGTPQLPNAPPTLKPPGGVNRPGTEPSRPGVDARPPRRVDADVPPRPVAPPDTSAPPPGGPAASPPARGDNAAAPATYQGRSADDVGGSSLRQSPASLDVAMPAVAPPARAVDATESTPGAVALRSPAHEVSDGLLLQRFVVGGEQAAFTALVRRHERFVLGVCERVLGDPHAARDAVQLTFLVLARKAAVLDRHGPLSGWLWTVAWRQALRLRALMARRRRKEKQAANGRPLQAAAELAGPEEQEVRAIVREELQRLPEKYRAPLLLCYFGGCTHEEAAAALGMPRGSMAKRIGEALERLRERLLARGFAP